MNKEFFKKCWENQRSHALIVLMIWIVFLTILMGMVSITNLLIGDKSPETNMVEKKSEAEESTSKMIKSYYDKLHHLMTSDYEFIYSIMKNREKIKFEGIKLSSTIVGYKQDALGIVKYKIENKKIYQILIDNVIEITNLYEDIDASLLDLNYIIGLLDQVAENDVIITEEELITKHAYNLTQDEEELEIIVVENEENIEEIQINRNNEVYQLQYQVR